MSNYPTKSDLKNAKGVNTSNFAKKSDLAYLQSDVQELDIDKLKNVSSGLDSLKSKVDNLDVDKLLPVPTDLSMLSYVVKNEVVKKDVYHELVKKVNAIDTSRLVKKQIMILRSIRLKVKHLV